LTALTIGCLTRPPNPVLFGLLYAPQLASDRRTVLPYLLRIDAAHVAMLARQGLLARRTAAALLAVNQELTQALAAGEEVLGSPRTHRGVYFLYESLYIERLGATEGGAAHLARSRNDINATVTRMRLRDELIALMTEWVELLEAAHDLASRHVDTVMCGFTHLQPAQPTTLGHYVCGLLAEQVRSAEWLAQAFEAVNRSPMGAAAGFGTSFRVDRAEVARLLGFDGVIDNAADAVASRDYLVQVSAALAMAGVSLTRLATDLQTWSSAAYSFVGWPDDLVSTSSIMPQKRNAFVLENIRGRCTEATAALLRVLMGMKSTPFTNSVEVASETSAAVWPALDASARALGLTRLLVERMEVFPDRMLSFLSGRQTTFTAVADLLVARHGLAFRTAHEALGRLARETTDAVPAEEVKVRLETILHELLGRPVSIALADLEQCLDPAACVGAAAFGGGPAAAAVREQLQALRGRQDGIRERLQSWREGSRAAERHLHAAVTEIGGRQALVIHDVANDDR
jgi:argininosuccinate lyase